MGGGLDLHNILYQDPQIRIELDIRYNPYQHSLYLYTGDYTSELKFDIPIGSLEEIAKTSRDRLEDSIRRLLGDCVVEEAFLRGLTVDSIGVAISQAYILEKMRTEEFESKKRAG